MLNFQAREGSIQVVTQGVEAQSSLSSTLQTIFKDCVALSYRTIYQTCKEFYHLFGLCLSLEKYEFFAEGIPNKQSNSLAAISRFHVGLLPIRHLGVLVISTCLHLEDCQALVDKITRRVHSWTTLQLIVSILQNLTQFWCRHFILPKRVICNVGKICFAFLWKGNIDYARGANDKCQLIYYPKSEGGFGL